METERLIQITKEDTQRIAESRTLIPDFARNNIVGPKSQLHAALQFANRYSIFQIEKKIVYCTMLSLFHQIDP
jgi:hypothetical protein